MVRVGDLVAQGDIAERVEMTLGAIQGQHRKDPDWPDPVWVSEGGQCILWAWPDVRRWYLAYAERSPRFRNHLARIRSGEWRRNPTSRPDYWEA